MHQGLPSELLPVPLLGSEREEDLQVLDARGTALWIRVSEAHPDFPLGELEHHLFCWQQVRHPNVLVPLGLRQVEADDGSWSRDGFCVTYFRHLPSWCLSHLMRRASRSSSPVPLGVASALVAELLLALHAIHQACAPTGEPLGLVHRALLPHDLLVSTGGSLLVPAPALVCYWEQTGCRGPAATALYMPRYLSPEQVQGLRITPFTDLFAAACLLWELLTGRRPFDADSQMEQLYRVFRDEEQPPSVHRRELPDSVDALLRRGLAKDPAQAFPDAPTFLEHLIAALPPASPAEVADWARGLDLPPRKLKEVPGVFPEPEVPSSPPGPSPYRDLAPPPPPAPEPPAPAPPVTPFLRRPEPRWRLAGWRLGVLLFTALVLLAAMAHLRRG
jgi:serine/threonine-protein kinase